MSYGPNFPGLHRRAGDFVDRTLRGSKPADIPVGQPTRFDLAINLMTAQPVALRIPEIVAVARGRGNRVNRRTFMLLLGAATTGPFAARAQQTPDRTRRIGFLFSLAPNDPEAQPRIAVFKQKLQEVGWTDGVNTQLEFRWAAGDRGLM